MSEIEKTLLAATGVKPQGKAETRQKFLTRVVKGVVVLDDDAWEGLEKTEGAQDWANDAIKADNDGKDIADFPDVEDQDDADAEAEEAEGEDGEDGDDAVDEADEEEEVVDTKSKKPAGKPAGKKGAAPAKKVDAKKASPKDAKADAKKPAKADAKKTESKKPAKASGGGGPSARRVLKLALAKKPTMTTEELKAHLEKKGLALSDLSISSVRADTRDTIKALNEAGVTDIAL